MKIVVNATPLIALAIIGQLELLQQMFEEVIVPTSVFEEVTVKGVNRPGADRVAGADWIRVLSSSSQPGIEPLVLGLDEGEVEVLLLAQEIEPDWVVIDERQARRVAKALNLPVKGTLGILLAAVMADLLLKDDALDGLKAMLNGGIRISPEWQNWFTEELDKI